MMANEVLPTASDNSILDDAALEMVTGGATTPIQAPTADPKDITQHAAVGVLRVMRFI